MLNHGIFMIYEKQRGKAIVIVLTVMFEKEF